MNDMPPENLRGAGKPEIELLAPAGSMESLRSAVQAGADAVYMGGLRFGARAYAENPGEDDLCSAIDFCHMHGKKLYLTVNTLLKERELAGELEAYLAPYYEQGVDAVLVQDLGVLSFLRRTFPKLELHISTQMAVAGPWGAAAARDMGASRLVLPRELSLPEIIRIREETGMEVEAFVHGALCYCCSGQCLMSSMIGGRSGNRGRCAQPCRLPYNGRYLLNLKDLCTLDLLPALRSAGICSWKIEGRMKSPLYTAGVVMVYRRYLDRLLAEGEEKYQVREEDRVLLRELFDRGGFTDGYYFRHNGPEMIYTGEKPKQRPVDEKLRKDLEERLAAKSLAVRIRGRCRLSAGEPAVLEVGDGRASVCVRGAAVETAKNAPLPAERVKERILRTGGTPFVFDHLTVEVGEDAFLPMGALNDLRRQALSRLEEEILRGYRRFS